MSETKIAPLAGAAWSADILTGQREFPVYKGKKDRGFKEVLDKAMEGKPWKKETAKNASTTS